MGKNVERTKPEKFQTNRFRSQRRIPKTENILRKIQSMQ